MRGIICEEELDIVGAQDSWQAYYFIDAMRAAVHEGFTKSDCDTWAKGSGRDAMEETICTLSSSIGGCIRVKQTGLPVAYDNILYTVGYIFYAAACLAWAPGAGMYNPFLVTTVYIIFSKSSLRLQASALLVAPVLTISFSVQRCSSGSEMIWRTHLGMTSQTCLLRSSARRLRLKSGPLQIVQRFPLTV